MSAHRNTPSRKMSAALAGSAALAALALAACGPSTDLAADAPAYDEPAAVADVSAPELDQRVAAAQTFINGAGQASLMQTAAGELALVHASNPDVKAFAQLMVDQHGASIEALSAAAAAAALAPPPFVLAEPQLRSVNALAPAAPNPQTPAVDPQAEGGEGDSGAGFDAEYLAMEISLHESAIRAYEDYARTGTIEPVQVYAEQSLAGLREHLARARQIQGTAPEPISDLAPPPS